VLPADAVGSPAARLTIARREDPMSDDPTRPVRRDLHEMIWPETGLHTRCVVPVVPKNQLGEDDAIDLQIDFLTLSLTPLEFIQLASFLRMSVDGLLEEHPAFQRAVINAFDIRD
jgi:hypothetical protein